MANVLFLTWQGSERPFACGDSHLTYVWRDENDRMIVVHGSCFRWHASIQTEDDEGFFQTTAVTETCGTPQQALNNLSDLQQTTEL
jgi:hypothetical protein